MATGDKLVNLDELKLVYDKLHVPSVQVQIPTGQWSGSSTRTYTVNATNVTADTIIDWAMDSSINYLTSDLTVTPGSGTIQFSTTAIPSGTINVTLFFPGVKGEVVIQALADVYSKSQVDTLLAAKVSTSNIVNKLDSTETQKPGSANMLKTLNDKLTTTTSRGVAPLITSSTNNSGFTIGAGEYFIVVDGTNDGTYIATSTITLNASWSDRSTLASWKGGLNALNSKITNRITTESVLIPWSDIPSGSWAVRGGLYRANVNTINYFSKTPNVIQTLGWNGSIVPIVQMDGSGAAIQIIAGQAIPQDTSGGVTINGYFFST